MPARASIWRVVKSGGGASKQGATGMEQKRELPASVAPVAGPPVRPGRRLSSRLKTLFCQHLEQLTQRGGDGEKLHPTGRLAIMSLHCAQPIECRRGKHALLAPLRVHLFPPPASLASKRLISCQVGANLELGLARSQLATSQLAWLQTGSRPMGLAVSLDRVRGKHATRPLP